MFYKIVALILFALFLSSCGDPWVIEKDNVVSCQAKPTAIGIDIVCSNGTVSHLANGQNGLSGKDGAQGDEGPAGPQGPEGTLSDDVPAIAITPCGPDSSPYKEALLGLVGGAVYSEVITQAGNANTIRNSLLPDGNYYDTDDSACNFTISTDSASNRLIAWDGSSHNGGTPYHSGSASYNSQTKNWEATYN